MAKGSKVNFRTNQLAHEIMMKMVGQQTMEISPEDIADRAHRMARAYVAGCLPISCDPPVPADDEAPYACESDA